MSLVTGHRSDVMKRVVCYMFVHQVFANFGKKQSNNLEQQEATRSCAVPSPVERVLSLLRNRTTCTELRALVVEEPEDLETDDEGLISFEEERAQLSFNTDTLC